MLFFYYLAHTSPSFLIGDADEIDPRGQVGDVDVQRLALALRCGHLLPERVEDFGLREVFSRDGDKAVGGVGVKGGEGGGFVIFYAPVEAGLA